LELFRLFVSAERWLASLGRDGTLGDLPVKYIIRLFFAAVLFVGVTLATREVSVANQSPIASYCLSFGATAGVWIPQAIQDIEYAAGCKLEPGDLFADGPLYSPIPTTVSGLTFTIPANVWVSQGARVVTQAFPTSAPNNTTSYWWLQCNQCNGKTYGTWTSTTVNTAPNAYSTLQYEVNSSSGTITAFVPTYGTVLLASGFLNIGYTNTGEPQVTYGTTGSQMLFTSTVAPTAIGSEALFFFQWLNTACSNTSSSAVMANFKNDDPSTPSSPVIISCSVSPTNVFNPTLLVDGLEYINGNLTLAGAGALTVGTSMLDEGLSSATVTAICGANATALEQCPWGNPVPLATSTPVPMTNSTGGISTTVAAWTLYESNTNCNSSGSLATDELFAIQNYSITGGVNVFSVLCNGNGIFNNQLTVGSLVDNGALTLSSLTPSTCLGLNGSEVATPSDNCIKNITASGPLISVAIAGAQVATVSSNASQPLYADTGNQTVATGTTANTNVQIGSTVSLTTTVSGGPSAEWLEEDTIYGSAGSTGFASENISLCATSATTSSGSPASSHQGSVTCAGSPANAFLGGPPFGEQSASGLAQYGLSQTIVGHRYIANNTTDNVKFFVQGSTTGSVSCYCWGSVKLYPI
jgi:hypothetical protein